VTFRDGGRENQHGAQNLMRSAQKAFLCQKGAYTNFSV
jgi:hypothetical protein